MTTACIIFLCVSLASYLAAAFLYQGRLFLSKPHFDRWGQGCLQAGVVVHALGVVLHLLMSGMSPFSNMLTVVSLLIVAFIVAGLAIERFTAARQLGLLLAPLAFFGLLYPMLMPVRFDGAESMLIRFPWLGVHVMVTLLGHVGFALAFCGASVYLLQSRQLKKGQLNRFLPALDTAGQVTDYAVGYGFFLFSVGLAMGIIWLFGAPGEYLGRGDPKIWMAAPTWLAYAAYLYLRGVRRQYSSRLKWLVIVGFLFVVANLLGVRHDFVQSQASQLPSAPVVALGTVKNQGGPNDSGAASRPTPSS